MYIHIYHQVRGVFAVVSAGLAATVRKIPAYKMQVDARPDNGDMQPLTLYGYESSKYRSFFLFYKGEL